jgi:hypothetical protein
MKLGRQVYYDSTVVRDLLYFLEYDPDVESYQERPFTLADYGANGAEIHYTPALLVMRPEYRELVECAAVEPDTAARGTPAWELGRTWAAAHHHRFTFVSGTTLRAGAKLGNLQLLWRYRQLRLAPTLITQCRTIVAAQPNGLSLAELTGELRTSGVGDGHMALPYLYHLLWRRVLQADLDRPLDGGTLLRCVPDSEP